MYNIHELIHLIGICPDNYSHLDLMDIVSIYYYEFQYTFHIFMDKLKQIYSKICGQ